MAGRLMLVDDHPVVRQGLKSFLELHDDLTVVAEAGSLAEARTQLTHTRVDLLLLDLQLPDGSGLSLIPEVLVLPNTPRILVLTSFLDEDYVREALRRGASGYLSKHSGTKALLDGVRATLRGELPLDPGAVRLLAQVREDPLDDLTAREREVLALLGEGLSNRDLASRLGLSEKTIKAHLGRIFTKLGVRDRTQAALWAKKHRL